MSKHIRTAFLILPCLILTAMVLAVPAQAKILGEFTMWIASKSDEQNRPVCVMSSSPQKDEGNYTKRGDIFAIITHRPAEDRVGEVSIQAGYTYKKGSNVTVSIDGKAPFKLFTQGGYAWTYEAADDRKLVAAMRAGNAMVVKGTSSRGTLTTDTYSLSGFTAAYNAISQACGVK